MTLAEDDDHQLAPKVADAWLTGWGEEPSGIMQVERLDDPSAGIEFKHGGFAYRVKDGEVRLRRLSRLERSRYESRVESTFPSIEVSDGNVIFPIHDIVEMGIRAADDGVLSQILFDDEKIRREFLEAVGDYYGPFTITSDDRRSLLARLRERVHSEALDRAIALLTEMERKMTHVYSSREYQTQANNVLRVHAEELWRAYRAALVEGRMLEAPLEPKQVHRLSPEPDIPLRGEKYEEVRDYWRARLEELFAPPTSEEKQP